MPDAPDQLLCLEFLTAVDLDALAGAVARISEFAADCAGEIAEADVNPLRCTPARVLAVDALITKKGVA